MNCQLIDFACYGKNFTDPLVCSSKGVCSSPNNCTCNAGYFGEQCQNFNCFGIEHLDSKVCSSYGLCVQSNNCSCFPGYIGESCQFPTCFGKNSSDPSVCSGNGICSGPDRCMCKENFGGELCRNSTSEPSVIPDCLLVGNNYIRYYKTEKSFVIEPTICSKEGWGGVSFHKKEGIDSAMFLAVSWYSNGKLQISEISSHANQKLNSKSKSIGLLLPDDKNFPNLQFNDKQKFLIRVDDLLLKNYDFISVVCSSQPPDASLNFPRHGTVLTRPFNISRDKTICDTFVLNGYSNRISDTSESFWFLEMGVYLVLFVLLILTRNLQPLKSRGFVPYLALLSQYGATFSSIQHFFFDMEWRSQYGCLLQTICYETFLSVIFMVMPLNYLRYVLLINMNKEKENVSQNGEKRSLYFNLLLVVKFIVKPIVSLTIICAFWLFTAIVDLGIIVVFSPNFNCSTGKSFGMFGVHLFYNVFFGIVLFGIAVIDIVTSFIRYLYKIKIKSQYKRLACLKVTRDQILDFFFKGDPFYFRIEQIIAFVVFILYFTFEMINFNVLIWGTENGFYFYFGKYFSTIGRSAIAYVFALYQIIIPLIMSLISLIVEYIKSRKRPQVPLDELDKYLQNDELFDIFLVFAKEEWSQENVLAYRDIQKFKRAKSEKKPKQALSIYKIYLNGESSPLEINIDSKSCHSLSKLIHDEECKFEKDTFEQIEKTLKVNISDTWSRFVMTSKFSNFQKNQEIINMEMRLM
jgi:hypothetical protein